MNDNEAINTLQYLLGYENAVDNGELETPNNLNSQEKEALRMILEEIQQYRAIGTVKEIRIREAEFAVLSKRYLSDLGELMKYQSIGTIEEFKAFKLGRLGNKGFITIGQTIEEFKQEIRAKAIDEFAERIKPVINEKIKGWTNSEDLMRWCKRSIDEVAEQMKGEQDG